MEHKIDPLNPYFFDHATQTFMFATVKNVMIEKMDLYFTEYHPLYVSDELLQKEILAGLNTIRSFFMAHEKDFLLFSPSYSESIKKVFNLHLENFVKITGRNQIFYLPYERKEILDGLKEIEKAGCILQQIPINHLGQIDYAELKKRLTLKTGLICLSWADPLTGLIQPLEEMYQIATEKNISIYLDTTMTMGKIYFRFSDLPITYMTFNPYQVGGPRNISIAVVRYQQSLKSFIPNIFTSSKVYPEFLALSVFCYELMQLTEEFFFDLPEIKELFEKEISEKIPEAHILFQNIERLQTHSIISFPNVNQEMFLYYLTLKDLYASIGSIDQNPIWEVLNKLQVPLNVARSSLVFSFSFKTKQNAVKEAVNIISQTYKEAVRFLQNKEFS